MRISVKRSGGFAGLEETIAHVDTAHLNRTRAQEIERLVERAATARRRHKAPQTVGADQFHYELTIEDAGKPRVVSWTDDGSADAAALRGLVDRLASES